MDIVSYILSRQFTKQSLIGMGALKGAPCTIASIVDNLDDTHDITFLWKDNTDVTHTSVLTVKDGETPAFSSVAITGGHRLTFTTQDPVQSVSFDVMDGAKGDMGVSVVASNVDENNNLTLTLSNGNVIDAGKIKAITNVDNMLSTTSSNPVENKVITNALNNKVDKETGKGLFSDEEKTKLANIEDGAQVNVLEKLIVNGQEATIVDKSIALTLITSAVSNLQNYYLKSETYTKTEVEELIGSTVGVTIEIVQELPTIGQTNVIYFLPTETTNVYSQYIYTATDGWVLIGSTSVDLSNYYTKGQVDTLLNGKQNVLTIDAFPTAMSNNPVASGGVYSAIAQMQPQFQFTNMPIASVSNLGFVYQYTGVTGTYTQNMFYRCVYDDTLGEYKWEEVIFHATVTVDSAISGTSTNPVQNKVIKEALDTKQDIMQYSTMPSAQDNLGKIVQYIGTNTANYTNGYFYKAIYNSESDVYLWTVVKFSADMLVDNTLSLISENPVQNKVITSKFGEYKTEFTGTEEEWNALTSEEQNVYDIMNITNDGDVLNLGIYLEKKTVMPVASEDIENRIYLYTGTTTQNYKKGVVYQCVSDGQDPATYSWVALIDFGTAALKNSTDRVSPNNTDLVESQSVYSAINTALSSIYTPRGDITCAELTSALLISDNIGNVYETSDSGTTTALFLQGAGHPIAVGSNVGIINAGQGRILFNLMANAFDLTSYQKKDLTQAVEGATTVEGALGALSTNKAVKSEMSITPGTDADADKTTIQLKTGTSATVLTQHQDITGKANIVTGATAGDIATLDANGNLVDSGKTISDVIPLIRIDTTSDSATHGYYKIFEGSTVTASTREVYVTGTLHNDSSTPIESSHTQVDLSVRMNKDGASFNGFVSNIPSGFDIIAVGNGTNSYGIYIKAQGAWLKARLKLTVNILGSSSEIITNPTCVTSISESVQTNYSDSWHKVVTENTITNPNLLDNPWFTINQRNLTTYSTQTSGKKFTVDRWAENTHATVVKNTNGVTITSDSSGSNGDLGQATEGLYSYLVGKLVTASVMLQNGNIYSKSDVLNSNLTGAIRFNLENGFRCDVNTNSSNSYLGFYIYSGNNNANASISIRAVKLELGGVSTLAMDCPPNYAEELQKCRRYYEKNSWVSWVPCKAVTNGSMMYGFTYRFDVEKRIANWTMTVDSTKGNSNGFLYDLTTGTTIPNAEIVISNSGSYNSRMVQIKITHSSIVAGHEYRYAIGDNVFEISADII